jgi:hypothetical protein
LTLLKALIRAAGGADSHNDGLWNMDTLVLRLKFSERSGCEGSSLVSAADRTMVAAGS